MAHAAQRARGKAETFWVAQNWETGYDKATVTCLYVLQNTETHRLAACRPSDCHAVPVPIASCINNVNLNLEIGNRERD